MKSTKGVPEPASEPMRCGDLSVQVRGTDSRGQPFEQNALATDISMDRALLICPNRIDDSATVGVSYEGNTARFRIVWTNDSKSEACKIAVYKVEGDNCPWTDLLNSGSYSASLSAGHSGPGSRIQGDKDTAVGGVHSRTRRWPRHKVDVPLRVIIQASDKTSFFDGRGNELSEGGMALTAGVELLPGDMVDIEFTPPYSGSPIRHTGIVRNRSGYRYGIEFLATNGEEAEQTERLLSTITNM